MADYSDSCKISITPKGTAFLKYFENIRDGISQNTSEEFEEMIARTAFSIDGIRHIYINKNGVYEATKV